MNKELELEAMDMLKKKWEHLYSFGYPKKPFPTNYENDLNNVMLGLTSKYVEKQKLEFAIEQLNKLDSILQAKYEILSNMQQEYLGKMKEGQLASKKSGLRLAKEEIRRDLKELEQKLKEL